MLSFITIKLPIFPSAFSVLGLQGKLFVGTTSLKDPLSGRLLVAKAYGHNKKECQRFLSRKLLLEIYSGKVGVFLYVLGDPNKKKLLLLSFFSCSSTCSVDSRFN